MTTFSYPQRGFFQRISIFLEAIKFEHSIFALPFAYLGLILAEPNWPKWQLWFWITIAMISFRTMGMALNRLVDHYIDAKNPRTRERALPVGKLSPDFMRLATILALLIFEATCWILNPICFYLSPLPVALAYLYPWTKRFTWLSHFVLGIILGIAPYGAWLASTGTFAWPPAFLFMGIAFWVAGFDIIYALQDMEFDRQHGLFSVPACFGLGTSLHLTRLLHILVVLCWMAAGISGQMDKIYFSGLFIVAGLLIREHWLIARHGVGKIQEAFFQMNAWISVTMLIASILDHGIGNR